MTRENLDERWLLFEAGALSTKVADRVWTFLLDVDHVQVDPPLNAFQHTSADKADVLKMVRSIHKTVAEAGEKTNSEPDLEELFEMFWERKLGPKIAELRAKDATPRAKPEPMAELIGLVRDVADRVVLTAWRQDKTMAMLNQVYRSTVGTAPPSLKELAELQRQQVLLDAILPVERQSSYATRLEALRRQPDVTIVEPLMPPDPSLGEPK